MAQPYRATVEVDGDEFQAVSAFVAFHSLSDAAQMPEMGSLKTDMRIWVDMHDKDNMPFSLVQKLHDLANVVTREKIKPMKVTLWEDDAHENALAAYSFNGWVRRFETSNPLPEANPQAATGSTSAYSTINTLMYLELVPVMDTTNFGEIQIGN